MHVGISLGPGLLNRVISNQGSHLRFPSQRGTPSDQVAVKAQVGSHRKQEEFETGVGVGDMTLSLMMIDMLGIY